MFLLILPVTVEPIGTVVDGQQHGDPDDFPLGFIGVH